MQADYSERRHTHRHQIIGGIENHKYLTRNKLHYKQSRKHNTDSIYTGTAYCFNNPLTFSGTVVIAYNGYHTVIQTENRHKHKALQFKIYAENRCRSFSEPYQNFIHTKHHDRAYWLHDYWRQSDRVNIAHSAKTRSEPAQIHPYLTVIAVVEKHRKQHWTNLPGNSCNRSARNTHFRHAEIPENKNRVKNNINKSADTLTVHCKHRFPGRLHKPFIHYIEEKPERKTHTNGKINRTSVNNGLNIGLNSKKRTYGSKSKHQKNKITARSKKKTVAGYFIGAVKIFGAQSARKKRIDSHTRADSNSYHQALRGKGERHCRQRIVICLINPRNKNAVYHIIKSLYQHRRHHRRRHGQKQFIDRHNAHFILLWFYIRQIISSG